MPAPHSSEYETEPVSREQRALPRENAEAADGLQDFGLTGDEGSVAYTVDFNPLLEISSRYRIAFCRIFMSYL